MFFDTIVAPATKNINNAISIIRISGSNSIKIADDIFSKKMSSVSDREVIYGKVRDSLNNILDDCLCVKMKAPKSYTGEDTIEFYCHGGRIVSECIIREILTLGARLAEKGEFTKRAFLNGKMDLTQAESVIDAINAQTKNSLLMAQENLDGKLRKKVDDIRKKIIDTIMNIMAGNDFPDETGGNNNELLIKNVSLIKNEIENLLSSYDKGKIIRDGFTCAICGKPNVGKSSLLNAILKEDRAIVTEILGTTRDVVTERIDIGGYIMNIADTAGLRKSDDIVEKIGIEKSYEYMQKVDLVLYLFDNSKDIYDDEKDEIKNLDNDCIVVFNKTDLEYDKKEVQDEFFKNYDCIYVSAKSNNGIDTLLNEIKNHIEKRLSKNESDELIFSERHFEALLGANSYIDLSLESLKNNFEPDIASIDLESAASKMGEITGTTVNDEVIDSIFKNFCIGK